jgi:hypothetical protein
VAFSPSGHTGQIVAGLIETPASTFSTAAAPATSIITSTIGASADQDDFSIWGDMDFSTKP